MTNNEAIEYLKGQIKCLKCETGIDCEKCIMPNWSKEIEIEALNKGIEAIENQKIGYWIKYGSPRCGEQHYQCTSCGYYINFGQWGELYTKEFKYCPNCSARMENREEK